MKRFFLSVFLFSNVLLAEDPFEDLEKKTAFFNQYVDAVIPSDVKHKWVPFGVLKEEKGVVGMVYYPEGSSRKKMEDSLFVSYLPAQVGRKFTIQEAQEMEQDGISALTGLKITTPFGEHTKVLFEVIKATEDELIFERRFSFHGRKQLAHDVCRLIKQGEDWVEMCYKKYGKQLNSDGREKWHGWLASGKAKGTEYPK